MTERNPKILALRRRYPRFYARFGLPSDLSRGRESSTGIAIRLQGFLLLVAIGLVLNYSYSHRLSLHYLFVGGLQEWFDALQRPFGESFGTRRIDYVMYVVINGAYYAFLYARGSLLLHAMLMGWRRKGTWVLAFILAAVVCLAVVLPPFPEWSRQPEAFEAARQQ